ncbi:hypothetical protein GW930_02810 [Candidatus Saccharibacteria bacterium]|nr:hypothetical protein [Candidatus Saccharibacteria bacterium]
MTSSQIQKVSETFQAAAQEIDTIFVSFRQLHDIFSSAYQNLEDSLDGLPHQYMQQLNNAKMAFNNTSSTVKNRQAKISNQLYAQGLVLLVGSAESIIREMFYDLLKSNIRKLNIKKDINVPLKDVLRISNDDELATFVLGLLESNGNPAEKLNFQNALQIQGNMRDYLGINLEGNLMRDIHEFLQLRHVIIHNSSVVDQRMIDNLNSAKLPTDRYIVGKKLEITKDDYNKCFGLLSVLFEAFDAEIERLKLQYGAS